MTYTCSICLQNFTTLVSYPKYLDISYEERNLPVDVLICPNCQVCVALRVSTSLKSLDEWLQIKEIRNGWLPVKSAEDWIVVFIMSQILYNKQAEISDPLFDMPDPDDTCKIFWQKGCAVGYYSAKIKGAVVYDTREVYSTLTLDTTFVLPSCRGKGLGISVLEDLLLDHPDEDLAISTPISKSMAHVIFKFLEKEPKYRMKLWEVEGVGSEGCKKLLYFTIKNKLL